MPREYQVKINVDSSAAEKKLLQFEQKAQRTFDKLNKTSFKPEAFINGINISITKVMELATKQDQAAAKIAQANAKVEQAQQKTAQVAIASNAKIEAEQAKLAAAAQKTAQAQIAATAKVTAEQTKAAAQQQVAAEKTAQATINANAKIVQSNNKLVADQVKASTQRQTAYLRSADVAQKAEAQIRTESEKTVQKQIDSSTKIATTRMQTEAKIEQADRKQQQSSQQTGNTVTTENEKMAASYTKLASTASTAWNQIKMVIGYAGVASMFRSALTEMKAMSDELVTYQKVTGATAEQMKQVRAGAYQSAKQYGQAPSDYLESVARMARAGYGQQAEAMANLATKTQLVGDMSAEMASKFLIAVDAGYRLNGNIAELEKVLNAANVADNNYATSLAEIAEGMTLIAPLAAGMNISVNEAMASIGTMQALTQRSGTEVARAFRMIAINIAKDTETEVEEGFKLTQENIEDFNALLQEFASEELAAANAAGKLLSPMKAIEAIAKAWKTGKLSEQELFTTLNKIGGARYTNNIMALVKNFDVYQEMLGKFSTELTSADDEVNAMMDSWSRKLEVLKTSWVEMVNNRVSEDFIKDLLDMGTGFLNWTGNLENFITVGGGAIVVIKQLWAALSGGLSAVNPVIATIGLLATGLGIVSSAVDKHKQKMLEESQAAADSAAKAYDKAKAVNDLVAAYNALAADGTIDDTELEQAKSIQEEINSLVDDLPAKYNLVTGSIQNNKKALSELNEQQRLAALSTAKLAKADAGRTLENGLKDWLGGANNLDVATPVNWLWQNADWEIPLKGWLSGTSYEYHPWMGNALAYTGEKDADSIVKALDELDEISSQMVAYAKANGLALPQLYDGIAEVRQNFAELKRNYESTARDVKDLESANYDRDEGQGTGSSTGTGTGTNAAKEGAKAVDAYAESYYRLQNAIAKASLAQEKFNEETKQSKGDQLKFYGSALEAYKEELKAGRYNSTALHAAAKALMGEEAYNATGGYTQNVQAAMNATGSKGISLIDAITTLTAEYKNQKGQIVEGAGLAVLLEKLGYNVKDDQGNYVVKMTEDLYRKILSDIPGLTREILENTANAYDQSDKYGRNTSIDPEETKTAEEQIAETNKETAQTNKDAAETAKGAAETTTTAADTMSSAADTMSAAADKFMAASDKSTEQENLEALRYRQDKATEEDKALAAYAAEEKAEAEKKRAAEREAFFNARQAEREKKAEERLREKTEISESELETIEKEVMARRQAEEKAKKAAKGIDVDAVMQAYRMGYAMPTPSPTIDKAETTEKSQKELADATAENTDAVKELQKTTENEKWDKARTVQGAQEGMSHTQAQRAANKKAVRGALANEWNAFTSAYGKDSPSDVQDAKSAAEQQQKDVHEIAERLRGTIDEHLQEIEKQQTHAAKKASIQAMRQSIKEGNVLGAFGGSQEWADKYNAVAGTYDPMKTNGVIDEYLTATGVTIPAEVELTNDEVTFNDVVIGVKAVLNQYSANEVAAALEYLTDEEREAVIAAMVDKYSLAEVIASLDYVTNDKDRAAIIRAEIEKNGVQAVAAELNKLSAEKRIAYIGALVKSGDLATARQLLNAMVGEKYAAKIIAMLESGSYSQAAQMLAALTAPEVKTVFVQTVEQAKAKASNTISQAQASFNNLKSRWGLAVGSKNHPGGLAMLNDGTGAELYLDSQGAHVASGKNALVNLEKGAKVYTAEQTRQILGSVPRYALGTGSLSRQANYIDGAGGHSSGVDPARVQQLVNELNGYFDNIHTGDTAYKQVSGKSGGKSGSNTSTGKISSSGKGSASNPEDERWKTLTSLIEYILKRLNKALEAQEAIIDKQIQELEERRSQSEQQNKLEELQKSVTEAQSNLQEAMSQRSVRYLGDDGQWHWMADQKKVNQAQEQLTNAQEALQDYLNDLVVDAQIAALEKEKQRLSEEYQGYADLWSDILDAVDTPQGELVALINSLTTSGTGAQKNGAEAVRSRLIAALSGGSYTKNYNEALGEIAKASANNPSVPGVSDNYLASLIASSGINVSQGAMMDALQSIAGGGTLARGAASQNTTTHADTYYMINGVQIGSDMADLPMSEVLRRLSVMTNIV